MTHTSVLPQAVGQMNVGWLVGAIFDTDLDPGRLKLRRDHAEDATTQIRQMDMLERRSVEEAIKSAVAARVANLVVAPNCIVCCTGERLGDFR